MDEGPAVDVVYLDFSKAFDAVPHNILVEKLAAHGLDGYMLRWVNPSGWPGPKSRGQWSRIQLAASHERCPPRLREMPGGGYL